MPYEARSHKQIERRRRRRDREFDALLRQLGSMVSDKKVICEASTQYELSTTSEGARAVEQHTTEATQETHRSFAETSGRVDDKQEESRNEERELGGRARAGRYDTGVIKGTEYQIAEAVPAKGHLRKAGQKSKEDAHHCDTAKAASESKRRAADKTRQSQKEQLENMKLGFGRSGSTAGVAAKEGLGSCIRESEKPYGVEKIIYKNDNEPKTIDDIEDQASELEETRTPISQQELEAQLKLMQGQRREEPDQRKKPKRDYMKREGYSSKVESYKGEKYK